MNCVGWGLEGDTVQPIATRLTSVQREGSETPPFDGRNIKEFADAF